MEHPTRQSQVDEYFAPADTASRTWVWQGALVRAGSGAGLLVFAFCFSARGILTLVLVMGGIWALVAAGFRFDRDNPGNRLGRVLRQRPTLTDRQLDVWLQEGTAEIVEAGFSRLGITRDDLAGTRPDGEGARPLVIQGMADPTRFDVRFRISKGVARYSHYEIMVVYLTGWHLCFYSSVLDIATAMAVTDRTTEFHYQDVVSISTSSDRIRARVGSGTPDPTGVPVAANGSEAVHFTTQQAFCIRVPGDDVQMLIGVTGDDRIGDDGLNKRSGLDTALQQIRTMLNTYKNRALPDPPHSGLSHL
ncbi:hypothetical protein [Streptomyces griseoruber]|uniref:DUF3137 domain-containing protein n=1 Tax=Streptomyces griseoruber TaxID=1943 RepID=A0A101SVV7_9ACTN|nr:hypothetical protein [Streptomyces griseoruber]KUN80873.1 hypothetical protein AQJ64_25200 [Streptomyces griseoruber]